MALRLKDPHASYLVFKMEIGKVETIYSNPFSEEYWDRLSISKKAEMLVKFQSLNSPRFYQDSHISLRRILFSEIIEKERVLMNFSPHYARV